MTSKKVVEKILHDLKKNRNFAPPPVWMASLCAFLILPINFAAAEEVAEDIPETLVSPSEENEGSLDYLVLSDYFITAERIPVHRMETPSTVYLITAEEIEANHYQDLGEALSTVPGVFVSSWTNRATMNGSDKVLLLLNGQRLDSDARPFQSIMAKLNVIPSMKMIERIEIVKGGGSALYGSDAEGGVINVVTKKGKDHETTLDVNYGSWHRRNYELTNQGEVGKFSWFVTGGIKKSNNADYNGSTKNKYLVDPGWTTVLPVDQDYILSDYDDRSFTVQFDNKFSDRNSLTALFMHDTHNYAEKLDLYVDNDDWKFDDFDSKEKYNNLQISYNFKEGSSTPGFLRYFNNHKTSFLDDANDFFGSGDTRVQGLDYQNGWELGQHKFIIGVEYHRMKGSYVNGIDGEGITEHKDTNTAYYLQDTMSLGYKWTFVPGVRLDHSSTYKNNWSPKAALNYRADDKTKIYASWGRFYRQPTMFDRYFDGKAYLLGVGNTADRDHIWTQIDFSAWDRLNPEKGHTETIGFEHNFDDKTRLNLSLFNTKVNNSIYWEYWDWSYYRDEGFNWPDDAYSTDDGDEEQRGFEISVNSALSDKWNLGFAYSYIKTTLDRSGDYTAGWWGSDAERVSQQDELGLRDFYTPKNSFNVGINYKCGSWKANLIGKFASGFDAEGLKSYAVLDFNTSYSFTDWATIYFKVNNLTDKDYTYYANHHTPGRFLMGGLQFKF